MSEQNPQDLPIGAVDASGEPTDVAGVTPPEQPPMVDEDGEGEINGEVSGSVGDAEKPGRRF